MTILQTVRSIVLLAQDRNITYLAAGIAYYAFVSIIPILLLAVAVASLFGEAALVDSIIDTIGESLSPEGEETVTEVLTDTTGRGAASVVGFLTLTWGGLRIFRGLDQAFDEVYLDEVETSLPEQVWDAIVVLFGITLAIALVVAVSIVLSLLPLDIPYLNVIGSFVLVGVLTIALLPIYYVLPPIDVSLTEVLPGAFTAAIGWVVLQFGFRIYAANADQYAAYGLIGAVLLFVIWLYFASIVVLLGALVNAVRRGIRVDEET